MSESRTFGRDLAVRVDQIGLATELTGEALDLGHHLRELGLGRRVLQGGG